MAVYASTLTLHMNKPVRYQGSSFGFIIGTIDITNYNSTTTEETDITKYFKDSSTTGLAKGIMSLNVTSSENGYVLQFAPITGKFKAYNQGGALGNATYAAPTGMASISTVASVNNITSAYVSAAQVQMVSATDALTMTEAGLTEVDNDTDLGTFTFIAVGLI